MTFLDRVEKLPKDHYVSVDIENRCNHIACIGIGISRLEAMCIPLMSATKVEGYWDLEEETAIIVRLVKILKEKAIVGQNFIHDMQYLARDWGAKCNLVMDTMLAQHVMYSHMQKALYFLSSLYCAYHTFWKDEGKDWTPDLPEEQFWGYNCKDCVTTFEIATEITEVLQKAGMWKQFREQQDRIYPIAFEAMLRGVKIDQRLRSEFGDQLMESMGEVEQWFVDVLGFKLNPRSTAQMQGLFYEDFKCKRQFNRKTKSVSLDEDALDNISAMNPELKPLCHYIKTYRSLGVFLGTFVHAKLDPDNRMRCSYKTATVETYRWASAKSAFDTGTNLQNIPRNRDPDEKVIIPDWQKDPFIEFPGIRRMFIPDEGKFLADFDLARADAQVVAWEADDPILKQMFREGVDLHTINAKELGVTRQLAKNGVHMVNYGVHAPTMAISLGITVAEAEKFIKRWFEVHPQIKEWHRRTEAQLYSKLHMVENKFGYRRYYFDRPEHLLPEALAWVPQSTVGLVINYGAANIRETLPWVQILLQVHDSLVVQFDKTDFARRNEIREKLRITIPYDDPLVIDVGMKISDKSWGDCEPCEWKLAA
jgi:DNA polymerase-1